MKALAGVSVGVDIDRQITAAAAPVARKERRLCVGVGSSSSLEADADDLERLLRRDGREMIGSDFDAIDDGIDVESVETDLVTIIACSADAIFVFLR